MLEWGKEDTMNPCKDIYEVRKLYCKSNDLKLTDTLDCVSNDRSHGHL